MSISPRKERQNKLLMVSVIIVWLLGIIIYSGVVIHGFEEPKEPVSISRPQRRMGVPPPPDCALLYNVGLHREWADCMYVGYNNSPWDKYSYAHRADD